MSETGPLEEAPQPPIGGHWWESRTVQTAAVSILTAAAGLTFVPAKYKEIVLFVVVIINSVGTLYARKGGVEAAKAVGAGIEARNPDVVTVVTTQPPAQPGAGDEA